MTDQPLLGLATTEQLFREIISRFTISPSSTSADRAVVLAEMLGRLDSADREYSNVRGY